MDIDFIYQKILKEVEQGHRGLIRISEDDLFELSQKLSKGADLEKILCILGHSSTPELKLEKKIIKLMNQDLSVREMIFTLNCAQKHIIEARFQKGQRLDFEFLEALKKLLHHSSIEVTEWTLRIIEGCGSQGIYFSKELDKIKPPPWKWFNPHQRAVREIIALLERRWRPIEKK